MFFEDLRYTARALARARVFTVVTVLILALGIGANAAVFSLVNSVLIRPLGFKEPDRLVSLYEGADAASSGFSRFPFSAADYRDLERDQQSLTGVGAYRNESVEVSADGEAERITVAKVTAGLFPILGTKPLLGRFIADADEANRVDVAILHWDFWQRRFAGDPAVLGRTIVLDRRPYIVIGVMPASFEFPRRGPQFANEPAAAWIPMSFTDEQTRGAGFENSVIGRLKDGASIATVQTELDALGPRIAAQYPAALAAPSWLRMSVYAFEREITGNVEEPLLMLMAAVGLVLLVALANVANLLLSRAATRERDAGIRTALGATSVRLLRLRLCETLVLAIAGGILGVLIARSALLAVPAVLVQTVPGLEAVPLDLRVLAFTAGLSVATALLFAWVGGFATSPHALSVLHAGRGTTGRGHLLQKSLVSTTIALAFVLLVAAAVLLRSLTAMIGADTGFRPDGVLSISFALPSTGYPTAANVRAFHTAVLERIEALPGVSSAALATNAPLGSSATGQFTAEGSAVETVAEGLKRVAFESRVHGPYFETLGIALERGRLFTDAEYEQDRGVAIVSQKLANRFWPGEDPIGKRVKRGTPDSTAPWLTVIGVVADTYVPNALSSLANDDRPIRVYSPIRQMPDAVLDAGANVGRSVNLAVRTRVDPMSLAAAVQRELKALDPQLALTSIETLSDAIGGTVAPRRFGTMLLAAFAGGALLLVAIGLYGLLAFAVARRRREIGVRIALGARSFEVVGMVLTEGLKLVAVGLAVGLVLSLATWRLLSAFRFEMAGIDLPIFIAVPATVVAVALIACGLPAYRAARIDPLTALREE